MALLVSIQQSACNALATWLSAQLATVDGGIVIEPRWFEADRKLPPKAISIIPAGPRAIEWLAPSIVTQTNNGPAQTDTIWSLGFVQQPIQLDAWAPSDVELDDLVNRLDAALNKGLLGAGIVLADPAANGLLLNLGDGWAPGTADVVFDSPSIDETPSSVGESMWRATYRGQVNCLLTQAATTARIATLTIKQRLRVADPVDTTGDFDITTITAAGDTHSTGP